MKHCHAAALITATLMAGCHPASEDDVSAGDSSAVETLSSQHLFDDIVAQTPAADVISYDVIAGSFADGVSKLRFLSVPEGAVAHYDPLVMWNYPEGTKLIKTFWVPSNEGDAGSGRRLIETRIIEKRDGVWSGRVYVWNDEQTEAVRLLAGMTKNVDWSDDAGAHHVDYRIPSEDDCGKCHAKDHVFEPLGPRTRQLNRTHDYGPGGGLENQVDHLVRVGLLTGDIAPVGERLTLSEPFGGDSVEGRARSYLDANCSHCHRSGGEASSTGLYLGFEIDGSTPAGRSTLGECRTPVAAGNGTCDLNYDIVPGDPNASILPCRVSLTGSGKMPELTTTTADTQGVELIRNWIAQMPLQTCP